MGFHICDNVSLVQNFSTYEKNDLIYDRQKGALFIIGDSGKNKYCLSASEEMSLLYCRFIEEITSYEDIIKCVDEVPLIDILKYNTKVSLTDDQIDSLRLLKEMI